eukprot:2284709-Rhodomonas_salina.8
MVLCRRACYATRGSDMVCDPTRHIATSGTVLSSLLVLCGIPLSDSSDTGNSATPRNRIQETAISVQFVPGMRFLVLDFGVYCATRDNRLGPEGTGMLVEGLRPGTAGSLSSYGSATPSPVLT